MTGRLGASVAVLVCVAAAVVLQVSLVARLHLPGAPPQLLVLVVVAVGLLLGPAPGALTGFCGGLLADLSADHAAGRAALVLTLAGHLAGRAAEHHRGRDAPLSRLVLVASVGLAGLAVPLAYAAVGALLGDPRAHWPAVLRGAPVSGLYDVLLAPLVLAPVAVLARWTRPGLDRGAGVTGVLA